jgi:hypothetical protein
MTADKMATWLVQVGQAWLRERVARPLTHTHARAHCTRSQSSAMVFGRRALLRAGETVEVEAAVRQLLALELKTSEPERPRRTVATGLTARELLALMKQGARPARSARALKAAHTPPQTSRTAAACAPRTRHRRCRRSRLSHRPAWSPRISTSQTWWAKRLWEMPRVPFTHAHSCSFTPTEWLAFASQCDGG